MLRKNTPLFLLIAGCLTLGVALFLFPRPAAAQCGSSVSSCKNCHEVQGKDAVNAKGAWHAQHAFGDFCEFCHAGNVKAKDEAGAHAGMVSPLADVKGSCQSCHANDYMAKAQTYADALGKPLATGVAPSAATPAPGAAVTAVPGTGTTTVSGGAAPCGPSAPTGGQVIDVTKVYAGLEQPPPNDLGNLILGALIALALIVLGGLIWHYEHPFERVVLLARQWLSTPVLLAATPEGASISVPSNLVGRPELGALLPMLASLDPATLRAVTRLLSNRENGPKVLQALSHTDLKTLAALSETDQKALAALLALAKEMKT
jgi:hypothetical protein